MALVGCAEQALRERANSALREGHFEAAISELQEGVKRYPESTALRTNLASARGQAIGRLAAEMAQLRAQSKLKEAEQLVDRALALEPGNPRLADLKNELVLAQGQRGLLKELESLISQGRKDAALLKIEAALRATPRQPELVALQRRLQAELRMESTALAQNALADVRPITLDFKNAPLSVVLEAITKGSGVNFVLDRDVKLDSRTTVYLRNARVGDAIDLVTGANQLARNVVDPQTVFIYPNTPEKKREHQELVVRVFYLGSAEAKTVAGMLRAMLQIKEPFIDERANMIALRESPDVVALAERLIALQDVSEPEVMLDLEVMEVSSSRLTSLGLGFPNSVTFTPLPEAGASGLTVGSLQRINSDRVGVTLSNLVLNLRREVGESNILASPRVRAKNREKARIVIGDKIPTITSTASATGFVSQSVSYQDVGLKLEVEPLVSPEDDVTIKLNLEVSNLGPQVSTTSGTVAYQIGTRNATTTLRLRDGETQLLAGLISKQESSSSQRVPGLGDLPIAGRLFSTQRDDGQRTELVLAITPHILRSAPRPDLAQAEMWIGSELHARLRPSPEQRAQMQTAAVTDPKSGNTPAPEQGQGGAPGGRTAAPAVPPGTPPSLEWRAPASVKVGDPFTATLLLTSGVPLRGVPMELGFKPGSVEVLDVVEGEYFRQGEGVTSFTHSVKVAEGRLGIGLLRSDGVGVATKASIVQLRLRATTAGPLQLQVTSFAPLGQGVPPGTGTTDWPHLQIQVQ